MKNQNQFLVGILCIGFLFMASLYVQGVSVLETDNTLTSASSSPITLSIYTQSTTTNALGVYQNATTTFQTIGVDSVDLNIQFKASSTASVLNWRYEFSFNNEEWYGEDLATASTITIAHSSTTVVHSWTPEVVTTVYKNISITPIASNFMRIVFYPTGATSTVWTQVALKSELNI